MTGTRTPESSQRAVVPTRSVTREQAERDGASTVAGALENQLGVQVNPSAYDYLGNPSGIQIQGFDGERVLILVDGERVIGDTGGVIDLESLPLTDVERIEFVTGPTSSLYGTGAIGGVVNIITGGPRFPGFSARGKLEGRSFGAHSQQATLALSEGQGYLMLDASHASSPALLRADASTWLPSSERYLLGVRAGGEVTRRWTTKFKARVIRDDVEGLTLLERPGLSSFRVDTPERADRLALSSQQALRVGSATELRLSLGSQWFDNRSEKRYRGSPQRELRERAHQLHSFEVVSTTREGKRNWTVGLRTETERFSQDLRKRSVAASGDVVEAAEAEVPAQTGGLVALYSQLDWRLGHGLALLPGVRFEGHTRYGLVAAPRLAASYKPRQDLIFRAAFGRGFRVPSAKELGFAFDHSALGYKVTGNPELSPERSWGATFEAQHRVARELTLRAGGFANWVEGLIDTQFGERDPATQVDTYRYVNVGQARTWGAEFDATWTVANKLRSSVGYAYLGSHDVQRARPLVGRPPHTFKAALSVDLVPQVKLDTRFRMVSESYIADGSTSPAFLSVGSRAAYQIVPQAEAYLGLENALNVRRDSSRPGDQRPMRGGVIYAGVVLGAPEL